MKAHTSQFKNQIKQFGRELNSKITYILNNEEIELGSEQLNSITPHYEGAILKSVMKQLDIDSNIEIPIGTILTYQFGLKVGNGYEYINFGNYVVKTVEKQEDTRSWKITCYDKMLYAMKDYENSDITFPITIRDYINAICEKVGLVFANESEQFANYDKVINNELYLDSDGRSLGYTFRDVLDELAEVTASTICINKDDELEIRYIKDVGELTNVSGTDLTLETDSEVQLDNFELEGKTTQETRSGKNLLKIESGVTSSGITTVVNSDGSITYSGTVTETYIQNIPYVNTNIPVGTYTFSRYKSLTYNTLLNVVYADNTNENKVIWSNQTSVTFTTTKVISRYRIMTSGLTINTAYNETLFLQLESGSSSTTFEQYGIQPSPDYPSELVSVGYENIFNKNGTINGQQTTTILDTGVRITQPTSGTYKYNYISLGGSELLGKTITISSNIVSSASNKGQLSLYYANSSNPAISLVGNLTTTGSATFTIANSFPSNASRVNLLLYSNTNGVGNANDYTDFENLIITEGTQAHSYIPYGKYGIEVKTTGKNLLPNDVTAQTINNITSIVNEDGSITFNGTASAFTRFYILSIGHSIPINAGTYTLSVEKSGTTSAGDIYMNINFTSLGLQYFYVPNVTYKNITLSSNDTIGNASITFAQGVSLTNFTIKPQLEAGSTQTSYKPYQSNTYLYQLDNPLRSIGNIKDLLYIKNGMLYVDRKIGSVDLSTITWSTYGHNIENYHRYSATTIPNIKYVSANTQLGNGMAEKYVLDVGRGITSKIDKIAIDVSQVSVVAIDSPTGEFIYELAEPYTEELGSVETLSTYNGITYLNAPNTTNVSYVSEIDTIDEEYLKDVNVNFGEKYGPINTIVLSRSADSDKVALSNPTDLEDGQKIALQISDNQIMNGLDRADYLADILNQLYGLEYYINDFVGTGICYLELCDRYNINIDNNLYKCIMLNDEINITQGLQELIHTDMPADAKQNYEYISNDDRKTTQAYIIAKKNEGTILEVTQSLSDDGEIGGRLYRVETTQTATDRTISVISQNIDFTYDADGNPISSEVNSVTTTEKRFTFNDSGLNIASSDNNFKSKIDETGVFFEENGNPVAQYTKDGSKQKDMALFGVYYYGMDDIDDTPMFVAQLYTDKNGEECFGHFYNRGDY